MIIFSTIFILVCIVQNARQGGRAVFQSEKIARSGTPCVDQNLNNLNIPLRL